ncbi:Npun_F5560 family protein [Egbenema bharatensis]|uniref:Npun_F5560 family protein n=1 Tax=Egbenema bharatensis TaxID=3463334 RepID=UPI003A891BA1
MTQIESLTIPELQAEVAHLRGELTLRDQLVQQLSQELFRLVKSNTNLAPTPALSERQQAEMRALREQLQGVEQQVGFYQEQLTTKDQEIYQLRQSVQELTDRSRMLEQVVQELPQVYKQKFEQRLAPLKEKIAQIQRENRQLHAELQSVSYRLAVRSRRTSHLDLPSFPRLGSSPIPSFGS